MVLFLVGTQTWENKSKKQKRNKRPQSSKLVQSSSVIAFQRKKLPSEPEIGSENVSKNLISLDALPFELP